MKYFLFTFILGGIGLAFGIARALVTGLQKFMEILPFALGVAIGFLLIGLAIDLLGFLIKKLFVDRKN